MWEPVNAAPYEDAHAVVRARLRTEGAIADDGAKDASRLSYCPVRREGAGYRFRVTSGRLLDGCRVAASLPKRPPPPPRSAPIPSVGIQADKYKAAALRRAAENLASASPGARHETLNKEAYGLARLGLSEREIADALMPTAVHVMGDARRWEAARAIRDAVTARRGAA